MIEKLFTVTEAAKMLQISLKGVYRLTEGNRIGFIRYAGKKARATRIMFRQADIEEFLRRTHEPDIYSVMRCIQRDVSELKEGKASVEERG